MTLANNLTETAAILPAPFYVGRWTTPDPASLSVASPAFPQSWNRYSYVLNNPMNLLDPSGLECVWDDGSYDSIEDVDTGSADSCS
ncbi:MAG TPA: RHS repeat-associated core domain-containing protein, partial [Candidatus Acidoferrum sp.]|nr:RHS repeat-associated core domain-containing protein [Candidatus Acidoferrum sp.]